MPDPSGRGQYGLPGRGPAWHLEASLSGSTENEPSSFAAANCSEALCCLRAVLVPVGDPDTLTLSEIATGTRRADPAMDEILLDDRGRRAHRRVSARLLEALRAAG